MKVAVLAGDGVGPEVIAEAVKVLGALDGLRPEVERAPVGGAAYDEARDPIPEATLSLAKKADAILFGAVGGPQYDALPRQAARAGDPQAQEGARPVREPPARVGVPRARGRIDAQARGRVRLGYPDPARAHRRHLLRATARDPQARRRDPRRLRHHALLRAR